MASMLLFAVVACMLDAAEGPENMPHRLGNAQTNPVLFGWW